MSADADKDEERGFEDEDDPDKPSQAADNERAKMVAGILCCCCIILAVVGIVLGVVVFGDEDDPTDPPKADPTPQPTPPVTSLNPTAAPFTLPPTTVPTSAPSGIPTEEGIPAIEIQSSSDTTITTGEGGDEPQGSSEVLQVFQGVDGVESFSLITFNVSELLGTEENIFERAPEDGEGTNETKTATLRLTHVVRDSGDAVSMTVFRLDDAPADVENLTNVTYIDEDGVEGMTFEVAPNATIVEVDVTDLLYGTPTEPAAEERRLEPITDIFTIKIARAAGGEGTDESDSFGSRQSDTPPELIIVEPEPEPHLCDVCPTGSFNNSDTMVDLAGLCVDLREHSRWDFIAGNATEVKCEIIELALINEPIVDKEGCDCLYMDLAEQCGCTNMTDTMPPEGSDAPMPPDDSDVPSGAPMMGEAEVCDVCPEGSFANGDTEIDIAELPLGEALEALVPEGLETISCSLIETALANTAVIDAATCALAVAEFEEPCGCDVEIRRLRKRSV